MPCGRNPPPCLKKAKAIKNTSWEGSGGRSGRSGSGPEGVRKVSGDGPEEPWSRQGAQLDTEGQKINSRTPQEPPPRGLAGGQK